MKHTSRLFGEFTYDDTEILTLTGLLGFTKFHKFVLKEFEQTAPVVWLLSLEEGGPEIPLIDPALVSGEYALDDIPLDADLKRKLHWRKGHNIVSYAVVTLPENFKHISMNPRTPIVINVDSNFGIQYPTPGLERRPVRLMIYRELISARPKDKLGMLIVHRKQNETINIGDEISIQIMEFENGGVRLGITAPKSTKISRGITLVTPKQETIAADGPIDLKRLEAIMKMYRITRGSEEDLEDTMLKIINAQDAVS